jgi:hypothetical protein
MQPIDECQQSREPCFRANKIVRKLLHESSRRGYSLNDLAVEKFTQKDWEQFYQLIGYSIAGYHELSMVSDASAIEASQKARDTLGIDGMVGCRDDRCEIHSGVEVEK